MITLDLQDLMALSVGCWSSIQTHKGVLHAIADSHAENTKEFQRKEIKRLEALRDKVNAAIDATIERQSIRIACKL